METIGLESCTLAGLSNKINEIVEYLNEFDKFKREFNVNVDEVNKKIDDCNDMCNHILKYQRRTIDDVNKAKIDAELERVKKLGENKKEIGKIISEFRL